MNDDELLDMLRQSVEATDQIPDGLREAAIRAQTWDRDMELMIESTAMPAVRSEAVNQDFVFTGEGHDLYFTVELADLDGHRIYGGIVPTPDRITILPIDGAPIPVELDGDRFDVSVTCVAFSLSFVASNGSRLRTPVISV